MSDSRLRAELQIEAAQVPAQLPFSAAALRLKEAERPAPRSGLTPEVLLVAGLLSMPALWTSVILGELPIELMLERYVIMVFGVLMIAEPLAWMNAAGRVVPQGAPAKPFKPTAGHLFDEDEDEVHVAQPVEDRSAVAAIFGDDDFTDLDVPADLGPVTPPDFDADPFDADPFGDADGNVPVDAAAPDGVEASPVSEQSGSVF